MTGCETLAAAALFACLARDPDCLPEQHRHLEADLLAIAQQESGIRPWIVRDETTGEGKAFGSKDEAVNFAIDRDALGHLLGLGMFQITGKANIVAHRLTIATALDGCRNMRAGADHYAGNLRSAALQLYNSGRINGAPRYAASVMGRLGAVAPLAPSSPPPRDGRGSAGAPSVLTPYNADTSIFIRETKNVLRVD